MGEAGADEGREFGFGEAHAVGVAVFGGEIGVEHGGVVGGESDGNAVAEKLWKGMRFDGSVFCLELTSEGAGEDIAARAEFERDAAIGEEIHEGGIVDGGDAVADALDIEEFHGLADLVGAADFASVHEAMQVERGGSIVDGAEVLGGDAEFVAADSEGDDLL